MGLLESSSTNGQGASPHARTRWVHLFASLCTLGLCLFAAVDAGKMRPNDGTVWLLGRPEVTVFEVPSRTSDTASRLEPGDVILGIGNTMIESPQDAANILSRQLKFLSCLLNVFLRRHGCPLLRQEWENSPVVLDDQFRFLPGFVSYVLNIY